MCGSAIRDEMIEKYLEFYFSNDCIMSELLRTDKGELNINEKLKLLNLAGEAEYVIVTDKGNIEPNVFERGIYYGL